MNCQNGPASIREGNRFFLLQRPLERTQRGEARSCPTTHILVDLRSLPPLTFGYSQSSRTCSSQRWSALDTLTYARTLMAAAPPVRWPDGRVAIRTALSQAACPDPLEWGEAESSKSVYEVEPKTRSPKRRRKWLSLVLAESSEIGSSWDNLRLGCASGFLVEGEQRRR